MFSKPSSPKQSSTTALPKPAISRETSHLVFPVYSDERSLGMWYQSPLAELRHDLDRLNRQKEELQKQINLLTQKILPEEKIIHDEELEMRNIREQLPTEETELQTLLNKTTTVSSRNYLFGLIATQGNAAFLQKQFPHITKDEIYSAMQGACSSKNIEVINLLIPKFPSFNMWGILSRNIRDYEEKIADIFLRHINAEDLNFGAQDEYIHQEHLLTQCVSQFEELDKKTSEAKNKPQDSEVKKEILLRMVKKLLAAGADPMKDYGMWSHQAPIDHIDKCFPMREVLMKHITEINQLARFRPL